MQNSVCTLLAVFFVIFYFSSTGPIAIQSMCTKTKFVLGSSWKSAGMDVDILLVVCDLCGHFLASPISQHSFANRMVKQTMFETNKKWQKKQRSRNTWNTKRYCIRSILLLSSKRNRLCTYSICFFNTSLFNTILGPVHPLLAISVFSFCPLRGDVHLICRNMQEFQLLKTFKTIKSCKIK